MRVLTLAVVGVLIVGSQSRAADWGNIKGKVVLSGDAPSAGKLEITKDQDHCLSKGPIMSENWVVNKDNKGVKNVFVWLVPAGGGKLQVHPDLATIKEKTVSLDQPCCAFEPHCLAVREGQKLEVKNSAPIAHNVSWVGGPVKNPGGNQIIPAGNSKMIDLKSDKQAISVSCQIHPWMKGWIWCFDHPYFAVTDADGNFEIKNAPAGKVNLVVWQEAMGFKGGSAGRSGSPIEVKKGDNDLGKIEVKP